MKLNKEQKDAIKVFIKFLLDPKEQFMILAGSAGTGKTSLIKEFIKATNNNYQLIDALFCRNTKNAKFEIKLLATTNKAVAVLKDLTGYKEITTIHSFLGLKPTDDFDTGERVLMSTSTGGASITPDKDTILIIDEASMLNKKVFDSLKDKIIETTKVVLVGDIYQLPPVKSTKSAMQNLLHKVPTVSLNSVMRHSDSILKAANAFRDTVKTGFFKDIIHSDSVVHLDYLDFKYTVEKMFVSKKYNPETVKILAWSNKRVQQYNTHLRNIQGLDKNFQKGESVITNKPIIGNKSIIPVDTVVVITNVLRKTNFLDVPGHMVKINNRITGFLPTDYNIAIKAQKSINKKASVEKDRNKRRYLWKQYFDIKNNWLDLRSQYASTVHKAQGSTYDEVFIDLDDIGNCNASSLVARMLYVAISRAKKKVTFVGSLPPEYCEKK